MWKGAETEAAEADAMGLPGSFTQLSSQELGARSVSLAASPQEFYNPMAGAY